MLVIIPSFVIFFSPNASWKAAGQRDYVSILNGKPVTYQAGKRAASAIDRPKDMSFLLDQMTLWNQGGDKRFAGKLALDAPCASGMSFGAMTSVDVVALDPRFKSMIAMSGASLSHANLTIPSLWMLGQEDRTIGTAGNFLIDRKSVV